LVAAFDFHRPFVLNGTHAEYDRIHALKVSQCSVRS
jgi:mRNA-degrading endonuclease HigB of HigAB toxin-antitoxin module